MKIEVKEIKPVDPPKEYILTLNQNELDLLVALMGKQGGYDGPQGWRELMNKLHEGLQKYATKRPFPSRIFDSGGLFPDADRVVPNV